MTAHDPLCTGASRFPNHGVLRDANCDCDLIARVRADERERWGLGWVAAAANVAALAHAERVAALLVEVIEEDADTIAMLLRDFDTVGRLAGTGHTHTDPVPRSSTEDVAP